MTPSELAMREVPSMAGMYGRYALDLSDELFNAVYSDLYAIAERQQKIVHEYARQKGKRLYIGPAQMKLNEFCCGRLSLGDALDYINHQKTLAAIAEARGQNLF